MALSSLATDGPVPLTESTEPSPPETPVAKPASTSAPSASAEPSLVIPVASDLEDIVFEPSRPYAYVADRQQGRVLVVSLTMGTIERSIPVGTEPVALAVSPSAETLFVGHAGETTIRAIDLATWTVTRTLNVPFLTWDLAAPGEDEIIATTHDAGYSGQYPYVLNATDGSVRQRLDPGGPVYMDFLAALSPDRRTAYLTSYALAPFTLFIFQKATDGTWLYAGRGPDFGSGSSAARDFVASPDGRWLYAALWGGYVEAIAANFTVTGPVGGYAPPTTVDASPTGQFVATSPGNASVRIYDMSLTAVPGFEILLPRDPILNVSARDTVWHLRVSPDGRQLVMIVGLTNDAWQDIEITNLTGPMLVHPAAPIGYTNRTPLSIRAVVASFSLIPSLSASLFVDGNPLVSTLNTSTGILESARQALADGDYPVRVDVTRNGAWLASAAWTFVLDATPPVLVLNPIPSVVDTEWVTLSGHVTDSHLRWVLLDDSYPAAVTGDRFAIDAHLDRGPNSLNISAVDWAENVARVTIAVEFQPPVRWFVHETSHFRIQVLWQWTAEGNVTVGEQPTDLAMTRSSPEALITVTSTRALASGRATEARDILTQAIAEVSRNITVDVFEPVSTRTLDGHPAASARIALSIIGLPQIMERIIVVVAAEWGRYWVIIGASPVYDFEAADPEIVAAMETFDVLASGSPAAENLIWAFIAGALIAGAGALAAAILAVRARRLQPPKVIPPGRANPP